MSSRTRIEWTEITWNPVTGCSKLSQGCKNCYAERMARRLKAMGNPRYPDGFTIRLHDDLVDAPRRWKRPSRIFVNSMSDLFHESIPDRFIQGVFDTMHACPQHTFQILTKRSRRLAELCGSLRWSTNIWQGVSVENAEVLDRVDDLRRVPAAIRFLSCEPLIGPLSSIDLSGIHWVIAGGESGPHARPLQPEWVRELRDRCHSLRVPFFFKQWGGVRKDLTGRTLDGCVHDALPATLVPIDSICRDASSNDV